MMDSVGMEAMMVLQLLLSWFSGILALVDVDFVL
jgi:hypothetical protein